jgi:predicted enzyme related to lactoylglutathione lyase
MAKCHRTGTSTSGLADVDAIAEHATALGGTVLVAPFDTPGFRNAVVADPQGAVFSISRLTAGN